MLGEQLHLAVFRAARRLGRRRRLLLAGPPLAVIPGRRHGRLGGLVSALALPSGRALVLIPQLELRFTMCVIAVHAIRTSLALVVVSAHDRLILARVGRSDPATGLLIDLGHQVLGRRVACGFPSRLAARVDSSLLALLSRFVSRGGCRSYSQVLGRISFCVRATDRRLLTS